MNTTSVKGLRIAKIDVMTNDLPTVSMDVLPGLKFFPRGKDKKVVEYSGGPDFENFSNWLAEHSEAFKEARPEEVAERKRQYAEAKAEMEQHEKEEKEKAKLEKEKEANKKAEDEVVIDL